MENLVNAVITDRIITDSFGYQFPFRDLLCFVQLETGIRYAETEADRQACENSDGEPNEFRFHFSFTPLMAWGKSP